MRPPNVGARSGRRSDRHHGDRDTSANVAALRRLSAARARHEVEGTRRAEDAAVVCFLSVARSVACRYRRRGVDDDDLEQVARIGLIKAVRRWRPERGSFLAYAVPTVDGEVKRYFRDQGSTIRIPRRLYEAQPRVTASTSQLRRERLHDPSVADVAQRVGLSPADVCEVLRAVTVCRPLSTDGLDAVTQMRSPEADREMAMADSRTRLRPALAALTDRERTIVMLRFVWDQSQAQIAGALGLSQMQISRLLRAALRTLHDQMGDE